MQPGIGNDLFEMYRGFKSSKAEAEQKNRMMEIGGLAGSGDYRGAASKALAYGDLQTGNSLLQLAQGQKKFDTEDRQQVAGALFAADTPEKWTATLKHLENNGHVIDPGKWDFANRDAILGEALGPDGQLKQRNDDRSYGLQEKNFNADEAYRSQSLALEREKLAQPDKPPGSVQEYEYAKGQGYQGSFTDYQSSQKSGSNNEYGLNPVWTQDGEGKWHLYQPSKAGEAPQEMNFGGNIPQPTQSYINQGTQFSQVPNRGAVPANPTTLPIDNAGKEAATQVGKSTGEAAALHASLASKLPGLQKVVTELGKLADSATYTKAGQVLNYGRKELGLKPTDSAVARTKYIAMVDNQVLPMLRDTFGAQFTVVEGETLRATLGDPDKTPEEKKAVLNAFIEQKVRNVEAAAVQGNVQGSSELDDALEQYK